MQPFALPRTSSRRVRHLAIRSHFHNPASRVSRVVRPFRPDYARVFVAVAVGFQLVMVLASWVLA
jgi:hypothetical protein